jgi:hypothetical protein
LGVTATGRIGGRNSEHAPRVRDSDAARAVLRGEGFIVADYGISGIP